MVVAIHGLGESSRYWGQVVASLARGQRVVVVDLLGFGRSPWPELGYTLDHHAQAVAATLANARLRQPVVLLAHQAGVPVAMAVAAGQPESVSAIVALGTPWYRSTQEARRAISAPWWLSRWLVEHENRARILCRALCGGRPVVPKVARFFAHGAPAEVIEDAFLHHWQSLSGTLRSCWIEADLPGRYRSFPRPVLALHGDDDRCVPVENMLDARSSRPWLSVSVAEGLGHNLAWEVPELVTEMVSATAALRRATAAPAPKPALGAREISVAEAAQLARISRRTVLSWVESGAVGARLQGNRYLVSTLSLLAHVFGDDRPEDLIDHRWLTPVEAAARLGFSHATLARHRAAGLPSHRVAGRRIYLEHELDAWKAGPG